MKSILDALWESYQNDHPFMDSEEEKRLVAQLASYEAARKDATDEKKEVEEKISECWAALCSLSERRAFRVGVRFAAMLFREVFSGEGKDS